MLSPIKVLIALAFCFLLYLIYDTAIKTLEEINKQKPSGQTTPTDTKSNGPALTASSLTMKNDGNYEAVVSSYSDYKLRGERNTAIIIVGKQMEQLYAKSERPNVSYLLDPQLYNILKSTSVSQFESYMAAYYPAFKNTGEVMNFYNDGNYQAVVVPFANDRFSNSLYGDARNAAIIMVGSQIGTLYPSVGPFDTSGLNDRQLYNLLTAKSFSNFKSLLKSYYPDRQL